MTAKPPSPTSCSTRQQKDSILGVRCRDSIGTSGEKGLCFSPYKARCFLFMCHFHHLSREHPAWGDTAVAVPWPPVERGVSTAAVRSRARSATSSLGLTVGAPPWASPPARAARARRGHWQPFPAGRVCKAPLPCAHPPTTPTCDTTCHNGSEVPAHND